jgi:hypothetical protein
MRYTRVYRRHTNFSIESISNTFNGAAGFGRSVVAQISRNGDLIHRVYLQVDLPATTVSAWVAYPGLRLLKYVEIEIGGQRIKNVGAQKRQAISQFCRDIEKTLGGAKHPFHCPGTSSLMNMGMPQTLVACC